MSTFTFTYADEDGTIITLTTTAVTWPEVTENFLQFLRGCGYTISEKDWINLESTEEV